MMIRCTEVLPLHSLLIRAARKIDLQACVMDTYEAETVHTRCCSD